MYQVKLYFSAKFALIFSLAILRQETFVRSFGVFWVRREWSGEAEGRKERERPERASEGGREEERGGEREGGRRTTGERREWAINHAEEVSLISGLAAPPLPLPPSVCLHRPTDRATDRDRGARMPLLLQRSEEQRRKKRGRERNVGRTDGGTTDRRSGGRRAARRSGGKSARMHFLPLHSPFF